MDSIFLQNIKKQVSSWREGGYRGAEKETLNILTHIRRVAFLHEPQMNALETYIYLKEIVGNKHTGEVFRSFFEHERDFIRAIVSSDKEAFELATDPNKDKRTADILVEKFGSSDYANQVYALTM